MKIDKGLWILKLAIITLILSSMCLPAVFANDLKYKNRGDRYEGIRSLPVGGTDIELISALVDYREKSAHLLGQLKVQFYLPHSTSVFLTVRELDYRHYYWLDKVQPPKPWQSGFNNRFSWPTKDVLQQLDDIKISDLGVIARLQHSVGRKQEEVAPVILYHSILPKQVNGYVFTFRLGNDARLICQIYEKNADSPIVEKFFPRVRAGRPFPFSWDSTNAADGIYKLVINGYFRGTMDEFSQIVHFYHRKSVEP